MTEGKYIYFEDFYPRPPRGGRHFSQSFSIAQKPFLSTPSARRATGRFWLRCKRQRNFYPRPPRGGRRGSRPVRQHGPIISIHALREEGDAVQIDEHTRANISIHALREEGDVKRRPNPVAYKIFLSTPSARRATYSSVPKSTSKKFLSTPSARRATRGARQAGRESGHFYPRPPRGGRQQKRRKTSPLLFHYKTICTDLEELVQKHPKKQL